MYLMCLNALVHKLLGLTLLLLQLLDSELKLVASLGGLVALPGVHPCHQAVSTLHLLIPKSLVVLRGSVAWKNRKRETPVKR